MDEEPLTGGDNQLDPGEVNVKSRAIGLFAGVVVIWALTTTGLKAKVATNKNITIKPRSFSIFRKTHLLL